MAHELAFVSGSSSNYQSWSLGELKAAIAAAQDQMAGIEGMHAGFAQSSHKLAALVDSIGLSRNAVAANWVGPAGSAATQSSSNMQAFSASAHEASYQSATATRELHRATRNHARAMHQIKDVDTSYHKSLAASGGNPAAATVDHHQRVQESERNRQSAVRQAELLDAKGDEYHSMLKSTQWPTMQSNGSTTTPPPTHYPVVPPPPTTNRRPVVPVTTTPVGMRPGTPVPGSRARAVDPDGIDAGTTTAGLGGGLGGSGAGAGGTGGGTGGGSGLNGGGLNGGGLGGSGAGGLVGGGALTGSGGARGALGDPARGALAEESRVGSRARGFVGEEGRGGMYGPGGGRRSGEDDEEKRRPDYLEEDDDPWGLGIENAVPAVIGEEATRDGE